MQSKPFGELADGRSNNYDFLRFLFATLVIFGHSFIFVGFIGRGIDPISWITLQQTWAGDIAVNGFFAISGCLVTASYLRSRGVSESFKARVPQAYRFWIPVIDGAARTADYFKKRALRIYPGFIVATLVCLLIVGPLATHNIGQYIHSVRWGHAVFDMLTVKKVQHADAFVTTRAGVPMNAWVQNELDGPMWSIRIEFECYFFVAALGVLGMLRAGILAAALKRQWTAAANALGPVSGRTVVLVLFVIFYLMYVTAAPDYVPPYAFQRHLYRALAVAMVPLQHIAQHVPGIVSAVTDRVIRIYHRKQDAYDHLRCLTCFLAGMCFYLYRDVIPRSVKLVWVSLAAMAVVILLNHIDIGVPIFGAYLMFYGAYNPKWKLDRWGEKHDLSYGLYLYGWPAQALVVYYLGSNMNAYALFAMAMTIATVCALASWRFVEGPALRLKSSKKSKLVVAAKAKDPASLDEAPPATIPA